MSAAIRNQEIRTTFGLLFALRLYFECSEITVIYTTTVP